MEMKDRAEEDVWFPWYWKYLNWLFRGKLLREGIGNTHNRIVGLFLGLLKWSMVYLVCFIPFFLLGMYLGLTGSELSKMAFIPVFLILFSAMLLLSVIVSMSHDFFVFKKDRFSLVFWNLVKEYFLRDINEVFILDDEDDDERKGAKPSKYSDFKLGILLKNTNDNEYSYQRHARKFTEKLKRAMTSYFESNGIALNSGTPRYYLELALHKDSYKKKPTPDEVTKGSASIDQALKEKPGDEGLIRIKGLWLSATCQHEEARSWLEKVLGGEEPGDKEVIIAYIKSLSGSNEHEKAREFSKDALVRFPGDVEFEMLHAWVLFALGREEDALVFLDARIENLKERRKELLHDEAEDCFSHLLLLLECKEDIFKQMGEHEKAREVGEEAERLLDEYDAEAEKEGKAGG